MAAALIRALTGAEGSDDSVRAAATDLREFGTDATPPADVPDLCHRVADIPGTDLARLIAALAPDPATADQALRDLTAQVQAQVQAQTQAQDQAQDQTLPATPPQTTPVSPGATASSPETAPG